MTANPSKYRQEKFAEKECKWCNQIFQTQAPSHLFCSDDCKDTSYTNSYFQQNYGISYNQIKELLVKQNYVCAICHTKGFKIHPNSLLDLNVDHCHDTKQVRGLLCPNCNRGLGLFKDNTHSLQNAIKYLEGATTIS